MNNAKILFIIIASLLIGAITTYSWNNQTLSEMVEEHNQQILSDCLTKARIQKTSKEILDYASNCNKDILTNLSTPRPVETITGTHSTGNTVLPLGFQLIPQASANSNVKNAETSGDQKSNDIFNENQSGVTNTVKIVDGWTSGSSSKIRTPKQIYEQVKHLGYREAPTISLISTCKASSSDVQKCILVGLVLMYNEAGNQQNSKACISRNNCFGINSGKKVYSSLDEGMENWVQKYNKLWYKANGASFFYSSAGKVSPSRYCTSEDSSKSSVGCPHGLSIATDKWSQLEKIIY